MNEEIYTLKSWAGHPLYQCNHCPFNSTNEEIILEHFISLHASAPAPERERSGLVLVADKRGQPVATLSELAEDDEISAEQLLALVGQNPKKRTRR